MPKCDFNKVAKQLAASDLFHLKSSFHCQDIYIFVLNFWSCGKNSLIGIINLISGSMIQVSTQLKCTDFPISQRQPDNDICSVRIQ